MRCCFPQRIIVWTKFLAAKAKSSDADDTGFLHDWRSLSLVGLLMIPPANHVCKTYKTSILVNTIYSMNVVSKLY